MSLIVASQLLVPEGASPTGRTLRLSYQMRDASGRTAVDTAGLSLRPLLAYAAGAAPPPGANGTTELPACDAAGVDGVSGVGECALLLDPRLFPASGIAAATVTLELRIR